MTANVVDGRNPFSVFLILHKKCVISTLNKLKVYFNPHILLNTTQMKKIQNHKWKNSI